jgi:hypothetical protein
LELQQYYEPDQWRLYISQLSKQEETMNRIAEQQQVQWESKSLALQVFLPDQPNAFRHRQTETLYLTALQGFFLCRYFHMLAHSVQ